MGSKLISFAVGFVVVVLVTALPATDGFGDGYLSPFEMEQIRGGVLFGKLHFIGVQRQAMRRGGGTRGREMVPLLLRLGPQEVLLGQRAARQVLRATGAPIGRARLRPSLPCCVLRYAYESVFCNGPYA